ncbi:MAG: hypothetical protein JW996_04325 [Candidatus Cloacimonetes bacterium]|nr:hypothetical protein [Candidatus Cloacimonadota bacterium]
MNKLLLIFLIISISACSILLKHDPEANRKLLEANLEKWKSFRIDGIIEINHNQYSLRKNFSMRKNPAAVRADIFDTGLLGLRPTPFLSVYMDTLIYLRDQEKTGLTILTPEELIADYPYLNILQAIDLLDDHQNEIVKNKKITQENVSFVFNSKMELIEIDYLEKDIRILLEYHHDLSKITLKEQNNDLVNIHIDKITFSEIEIRRLD